MSRSGYCGFGNDFLILELAAAQADPNYNGAVMKFNTPGRTADSTPTIAQAAAEFKNGKPIATATAYCARAACYVASQYAEIVMEDSAASGSG